MKDRILKFIEDNNLQFDGEGSELNGNCLALVGYALYLDMKLIDLMMLLRSELWTTIKADDYIEKIYKYGSIKNYAENWRLGKYKNTYNYEDFLG